MAFAEPEPEALGGLRSWGAPGLAHAGAGLPAMGMGMAMGHAAAMPAMGHGAAMPAMSPMGRAGWANPGLAGHAGMGLGKSWGNAGQPWAGKAW